MCNPFLTDSAFKSAFSALPTLLPLPRAGMLRQTSLPRVPLTVRHDVRFNRSAAFCCSHLPPSACGLFPCARQHPRQPRTAVMCAADPAPGRPSASGLVPLTHVARLSCAVKEPTNFFHRGETTWLHHTQHQQPLSAPAASIPPSERTPERQGLSSPSPFHGPTRMRRATGRPHRLTA